MAIYRSDSSSIGTLVVSSSLIATSSIQFVTNSLHIDYGLGQGGSMSFASFTSTTSGGITSASHAEGSGSIAIGLFNHAEGEKNIINGALSFKFQHLEGFNNTSSTGTSSPLHIEGFNNALIAGILGKYVHIEGTTNRFGGTTYGHIEGSQNTGSIASGNGHIEGVNNRASQSSATFGDSHIEGINNAFRQPDTAHIEGVNNNASFTSIRGFHLEGSGSIMERGYYVHIEGENNYHRAVNSFNHIKGYNNRIDSGSYTNNSSFNVPQYHSIDGANNSMIVKAWGRTSGISHSFFPPTAILNTTVNSQSLASVFSSGFNLRTYNTASEYIYAFGKHNSGLSTGNSSQWYSYIVVGGGENEANRANIMEIVTYVSGTMGTLTGSPSVLFYPSSSFIVFPGLQYYATNAAALAAQVPVGGFYLAYNKEDDTYNNLAIAY